MLVGQRPIGPSGGGGGTFIALEDPSNPGSLADSTPLLVAGGGGGSAGNQVEAYFQRGRSTTIDPDVDGFPGEGGLGGAGGTGGTGGGYGTSTSAGAGGGGWSTDGGDGDNGAATGSGGQAFVSGGVGGTYVGSGPLSEGGFGGGGGGGAAVSGGGGGYNGGGGSATGPGPTRGGGGGSYNAGYFKDGEDGYRLGEGEALVELIASPAGPVDVTATPNGTEVEICWLSPGEEAIWVDTAQVRTEIRRTDCQGRTEIIADLPPPAVSVTNLVTIPIPTTGWVVSQTGGTGTTSLQTSGGPFPESDAVRRRVVSSTATALAIYSSGSFLTGSTVTAGTEYTASIYYQQSTVGFATVQIGVSWYNNAGTLLSTTLGPALTPTTGSWERLSVTATAPANATSARVFAHWTGSTSTGTYEASAAMLTEGSSLWTYANGDSDGWSWAGTENSSTSSTQTAGDLSGCFTDRFPSLSNDGLYCGEDDHTCTLTYDVRYVGEVSGVATPPSLVPEGFIVAWPGALDQIPSGWSRVTALDERFPMGATGNTTTGTGGTSTHSHTTPGHTHTILGHRHGRPATTGTTDSRVDTLREMNQGASRGAIEHSHPVGGYTGTSANQTSASAAPGTSTVNHLPPYFDVVWIESDGTPTTIPVGAEAFGTQTTPGWVVSRNDGRFPRGATTGQPGGSTGGQSSHQHTVANHSHSAPANHTHTSAATSQQALVGPSWRYRNIGVPSASFFAGSMSNNLSDGRHTHPITVGSANVGATSSNSGGNTSVVANIPPYRRLQWQQNTVPAITTRIIGLYLGDITTAPAGLTRCDGTGGTPDMRNRFARATEPADPNPVGGVSTHQHSTGNHGHTLTPHSHTLTVGAPQQTSLVQEASPDLAASRGNHTHTLSNTQSVAPVVSTATSGTTNSVSHIPPYQEAHFVRLDATGISTLDATSAQVSSESFATVIVDNPQPGNGLVKHPSLDLELFICPTVSWARGRPFGWYQPIGGGPARVVSGEVTGRNYTLEIPVTTEGDLDTLEAILDAPLFWYQPADGPSGWFTAAPWSVSEPGVRRIRVVSVQLTEVAPQPVGA